MDTRERSWAKVTHGFKTKRIANPSADFNTFTDQIKAHFPTLQALSFSEGDLRLILGWHSASALQESCMDTKSEVLDIELSGQFTDIMAI
jgi:hypothetical protein